MNESKPAVDGLRAEVHAINSHKGWHRAVRHLVAVSSNLDPAVVMELAGQLVLRKPRRRDRQLWDVLLDVAHLAMRSVVAEFVSAVGPDDRGVEELRNYHPVFRELVDEARGPWKH